RWSQENYFRYMRQDYDFHRMLQYTVEQLDVDIKVNHPRYSKLTNRISKTRDKISRREANLYNLIEKNVSEELEENPKQEAQHLTIRQAIDQRRRQEQTLLAERPPDRGAVGRKDMPETLRYAQLDGESWHFQNVIKMRCYRAASAFSNLLAP